MLKHLILPLAVLGACDDQPADPAPPAAARGVAVQGVPLGASAIADATSPDTVVASWDGGQITYQEVSEVIKNQLIQMEVEYLSNRYSTETSALDQLLTEKLLEEEAKSRGLDGIEALVKIEIEDKTPAPTEEEIQSFYEVMKRQLRGAPLETVRPDVTAELLRRKQSERGQAFIAELKERRSASTSLPFPDLPRVEVSVDDDPSRGPDNATVTIVQFAEYQCPYCGKANASIEQVFDAYDGKVRMVYRDFPLSFHDRAIPAAIAANCAGEQDKYWEMHKLLMANQRALEEADLLSYAQTLGLDVTAWNTCREDPAQEAEVQADIKDGAALGVTGTPAFFINGIMLSGAQPYSRFKEIIDRELDRG